jgi:diguanylate cyclase (GGDEF)-like protein
MQSDARTDGGRTAISGQRAAPDPGLDLVRPEDEVGRFDRSYVSQTVFLRWLITLAYPAIVLAGLIPMHPLALLGSAGWVAATSVLATWHWRQNRTVPWYDSSYLFLDSFSVTFGILASANLGFPIWITYFMLMIEGSAERSTRFAIFFNSWCLGAYLFCVAILSATGWDAPTTGTVVVTGVMMLFIGLDLTMTFSGSRRLRAYIRRLAVTDSLTGLANRRQLFDLLARFDLSSGPLAVFVLDVDNFKGWNDKYGHLSGDQLLVRLARVLERQFPDAVTVSRYGGDEFVVLDRRDPDAVAAIVAQLMKELCDEKISASAGVAVVPHHEPSPDAALAAADDCLRTAKHSGKACVVSPEGELVGPRSPRVRRALVE